MAEAVVLIPGVMADARVFQHQITALTASRAVMVAPPVIGERVEEMASALLDALPVRSAVAGAGLGGVVALEIVRRAPERVNRLALIATDPQADTPAIAADRELWVARARAGRLDEVVSQVLPPERLAPGAGRIEAQGLSGQMAADLGAEIFVRQMRALQRRRDYQGVMRRIAIPTMLIGGELDSVITPKRLAFMTELIPKAVQRVIPEAGHLPMIEAPEAATDALHDWLAQPLVLG